MIRAALFNDTRSAAHYGCDLVMHQLHEGLHRHGIEPVLHYPVGQDWRAGVAMPRRSEIDAVIVNGEGSIHHPQQRPRAVYLAQLGRFARERLGVPAFLINATISEIDGAVARDIAAFDRVYVRESESRRVLNGFGVNCEVVPDVTVLVSARGPDVRSGVCGSDSVLVDVARRIRELCRRNGWPFRSTVWKGKKTRPADPTEDERLAGALDFASFLASHALVISGRFHVVTLCLATRTPFVAVESNTPKISSLLRDVFGRTDRVVDVEALPGLEVAGFSSWSDQEARALDAFLDCAARDADRMFTAIAQRTRTAEAIPGRASNRTLCKNA